MQYLGQLYRKNINGNFKIRTLNGSQNSKTEADYTWVHFSLASDISFFENSIYIYGKFNNYKLTEKNIGLRRAGNGLAPTLMKDILGSFASQDLIEGNLLELKNVK